MSRRRKGNLGWIDDGAGNRSYDPVPLPKRYVGKVVCRETDDFGKICVIGGKYGFSATLTGRAGRSKIPLVTSDGRGEEARVPEKALRNAIEFLRRVKYRNN